MRQSGRVIRASALLFAGAAALSLSGCGNSPDSDVSNTLGNLLAFNSLKAPPLPARENAGLPVECPEVQVTEGQAAYRTYVGSDKSNAAVKHQYSFGEMARECFADNGRIDIRIGISG